MKKCEKCGKPIGDGSAINIGVFIKTCKGNCDTIPKPPPPIKILSNK